MSDPINLLCLPASELAGGRYNNNSLYCYMSDVIRTVICRVPARQSRLQGGSATSFASNSWRVLLFFVNLTYCLVPF